MGAIAVAWMVESGSAQRGRRQVALNLLLSSRRATRLHRAEHWTPYLPLLVLGDMRRMIMTYLILALWGLMTQGISCSMASAWIRGHLCWRQRGPRCRLQNGLHLPLGGSWGLESRRYTLPTDAFRSRGFFGAGIVGLMLPSR